nr:biopolymer transporter ExbD [Microbulbifer sp. GX H0434]
MAPDLTPLLDIIFIVLVFLLLTANMRLVSLPMALPGNDSVSEQLPADPLTVSLPAGGPYQWGLGDRGFSDRGEFERALLAELREARQRPVALASDRDVPVQRMLDLFALLQKEGVAVAEIALQPGGARP